MFGKVSLSLAAISVLATATPIGKRSISSSPILNVNFPDPAFIQADDTYYAFATNSNGVHVPVATSPDFDTWTLKSGFDALPNYGNWSTGKNIWAPDVVRLENGLYIMYYSAVSNEKDANGKHCFGAASSTVPQGPYTPIGDVFPCHLDQGGAIDPAGFQDSDGRQYVVYKIDGNNMGNGGNCNNGVAPIHSTPIMLQEVDPTNGWSRIGDPVQVLDRGDADGPLIEAPSLTHVADSAAAGGYLYILFFSSNCYAGSLYDSSYATSVNGVHGPYTKSSKPLLVTGNPSGLYSPGGLDIDPEGTKVLFHADQGTSANVRLTRSGSVTIDVGSRTVTI